MSAPLDDAIAQLEAEVAAFKQGTPQQPGEGTSDWYLLRAKALGMSMLRTIRSRGLHVDHKQTERFYRNASKGMKGADDSD